LFCDLFFSVIYDAPKEVIQYQNEIIIKEELQTAVKGCDLGKIQNNPS